MKCDFNKVVKHFDMGILLKTFCIFSEHLLHKFFRLVKSIRKFIGKKFLCLSWPSEPFTTKIYIEAEFGFPLRLGSFKKLVPSLLDFLETSTALPPSQKDGEETIFDKVLILWG